MKPFYSLAFVLLLGACNLTPQDASNVVVAGECQRIAAEFSTSTTLVLSGELDDHLDELQELRKSSDAICGTNATTTDLSVSQIATLEANISRLKEINGDS